MRSVERLGLLSRRGAGDVFSKDSCKYVLWEGERESKGERRGRQEVGREGGREGVEGKEGLREGEGTNSVCVHVGV